MPLQLLVLLVQLLVLLVQSLVLLVQSLIVPLGLTKPLPQLPPIASAPQAARPLVRRKSTFAGRAA